jgi:hypothetical protein
MAAPTEVVSDEICPIQAWTPFKVDTFDNEIKGCLHGILGCVYRLSVANEFQANISAEMDKILEHEHETDFEKNHGDALENLTFKLRGVVHRRTEVMQLNQAFIMKMIQHVFSFETQSEIDNVNNAFGVSVLCKSFAEKLESDIGCDVEGIAERWRQAHKYLSEKSTELNADTKDENKGDANDDDEVERESLDNDSCDTCESVVTDTYVETDPMKRRVTEDDDLPSFGDPLGLKSFNYDTVTGFHYKEEKDPCSMQFPSLSSTCNDE